MPDAVLRGLWDIQQSDPAAYNDYLAKMGGAFAMLKLSWKVNETRDLLEEGKIGNTQLSDAEMEIMEARLNRLISAKGTASSARRSSWSATPCPSCGRSWRTGSEQRDQGCRRGAGGGRRYRRGGQPLRSPVAAGLRVLMKGAA